MPNKNPDLLMSILVWLGQATVLHASLLAFVLSYMRAAYDEKEKRWQRRLLEASICACLALGSWGVIKLFQWPDAMAVVIGSFIGYLGVDQLREIILGRLKRGED